MEGPVCETFFKRLTYCRTESGGSPRWATSDDVSESSRRARRICLPSHPDLSNCLDRRTQQPGCDRLAATLLRAKTQVSALRREFAQDGLSTLLEALVACSLSQS